MERICADYAIRTPVTYVEAGTTRQESMRMLPVCRNESILIHETARPLVSAEDFLGPIKDEHPNVSYAAASAVSR